MRITEDVNIILKNIKIKIYWKKQIYKFKNLQTFLMQVVDESC